MSVSVIYRIEDFASLTRMKRRQSLIAKKRKRWTARLRR
jgi:hypothetical protein